MGSPRRRGGGIGFFIENPRAGRVSRETAEGVGGCLQRTGAKYFFSGPKRPPKNLFPN